MPRQFRFDRFVLEIEAETLTRDGEPVTLQPLAFKLLQLLVSRPHVLVSQEALTAHLWPDVAVTVASLHQVVRRLRKDLGDSELIQTVPRRGYRFVCDVEAHTDASAPPAVPDRTFGRTALVADLAARLAHGDRLLTVTGPGGVGKTRVAVTLANHLADELVPTWFVDTAGASDLAELARRVASRLGLRLRSDDPVEEVARAIADKGAGVLILDDVDAAADPVGPAVACWLERAAELAVVVTSRVVLGVRGERLVEVPPLDSPQGAELYADRADREPDDDTVALVEALDGLPLAIELAASRARILPPADLLARIRVHLDAVRAARPGDRPERHHSLRAVFDTSWELLPADERAALGQLCAFVGPLRLTDAEAVLELDGSAMDAVHGLVDHSMLQALGDGRLRLLATLRAYALETIDDDALQEAQQRLAAHLAGRCSDAHLADADTDPTGPTALALQESLDDLVAAVRLAIAHADGVVAGRVALGAAFVLQRTGPLPLQVELLQGALPLASGDLERRILDKLARALADTGHTHAAMDRYRELLAVARSIGDLRLEARSHVGLAGAGCQIGEVAEARVHAAAALAGFDELGDVRGQAMALRCQAEACDLAGDGLGAISALEEGLDRCRSAGDVRGVQNTLSNLGGQCARMGRMVDARTHLEEALVLARELGHTLSEMFCIATLGTVHAVTGRLLEALEAFEEARDRGDAMGERKAAARMQMLVGMVHMEQERFEVAEATFADALGRAEALEQAVIATEVTLQRARLRCRSGRPPTLAEADDWVRFAETRRMGGLRAETLEVRAEVALARGELDRAERDARECLQAARERWSAVGVGHRLCLLGEVARARGDDLTVEVVLAEAEPIVARMRATPQAYLRRRVEALRG